MTESSPLPETQMIEINELLSNPKMSIKWLFRRTLTDAKDVHPEVLTKLIPYVDELLRLTFDPEISEKGVRAFYVLQQGVAPMIDAMLQGHKLQRIAQTLINSEKSPQICIARLASLTSVIVTNRPDAIISSCGYMFQFLAFINISGVYDFFEQVISNLPQYQAVQDFLIGSNFISILLQEIKLATSDSPKLRNIYRLFRASRKSDTFKQLFLDSRVIAILSSKKTIFENEKWEAIVSLYCEEKKDPFRALFQHAINIVKMIEPDMPRYRVAALNYLTKVTLHDPDMHQFIKMSNLNSTLMRLMLQFPNHSVMVNAIVRLYSAIVKYPDLAEDMVLEILPFCFLYATMDSTPLLKAASFKIVATAKLEAKTNPLLKVMIDHVPGYDSFVGGPLRKRAICEAREWSTPPSPECAPTKLQREVNNQS